MKIAVCDDDKAYVDLINKTVLTYFEEKEIPVECFCFSSAEKMLENDMSFDIAFLDIEMDVVDGIQAAKELKSRNNKTVIFIVTAYQKYLDDAMDLKIFRYIGKPFDSTRLYKGLDKAFDIINHRKLEFLDKDGRIIKIPMEDIVYVEVSMRNTHIYTLENEYISKENIKFFKDKLNASYFAIPHNSYIVNLNFVETFTRTDLKVSGNHLIPISQRNQHLIKQRFFKYIKEGAYD